MSFEKYNFPKPDADADMIKTVLEGVKDSKNSGRTSEKKYPPNQHPGENLHPLRDPAKPPYKAPVWEGPKHVEQPPPQKTL